MNAQQNDPQAIEAQLGQAGPERRFKPRQIDSQAAKRLQQAGYPNLLARLWAARGVRNADEIQTGFECLLPPDRLKGLREAAAHLSDAILAGQKILVVGDYDCDGATACAVAVRGLRMLGARIDYLVPNRFETGYGLSPAVVELALEHPRLGRPDLLLTVDNGIASLDGVFAANKAGLGVIITDHHLAGDQLPDALAIVNPNQPGCGFESRNLAGVGVMFYVCAAVRAELRQRGKLASNSAPNLAKLLDLVALGTVADVVKLDRNNRVLVARGLERIRQGRMQPGIAALLAVGGRAPQDCRAQDLGFVLGPRLNAAGRLADMSLGIRLLTSDDDVECSEIANELDRLNRERREIEQRMQHEALQQIDLGAARPGHASLCVFDPSWHAGVVGLVASRLKERFWLPTLAFAAHSETELKASGRSIPDVHLRDALDIVAKRHPQLIDRFGGHAMAAGVSIPRSAYPEFVRAFDQAVIDLTGQTQFEPVLETDGSAGWPLPPLSVVASLQEHVWGAGFPAPVFQDRFKVCSQRILKERHLKLLLEREGERVDAIWFHHVETLPEQVELAYELDVNHWQDRAQMQLRIIARA